MTNPNGLVLDIFQFTDADRYLELNAVGREQLLQVLEAVVSGRVDVTARVRARAQSVLHGTRPTLRADDSHRQSCIARYTVLEIIASNAIGLLHHISRVISHHGCDVALVLIATEGAKAIDVFHVTAGGAKLSEAAQHALTADLQRTLEGSAEAG